MSHFTVSLARMEHLEVKQTVNIPTYSHEKLMAFGEKSMISHDTAALEQKGGKGLALDQGSKVATWQHWGLNP